MRPADLFKGFRQALPKIALWGTTLPIRQGLKLLTKVGFLRNFWGDGIPQWEIMRARATRICPTRRVPVWRAEAWTSYPMPGQGIMI
jgi:hypothetical protein